MGILLKFLAIFLGLGLVYVAVKRALLAPSRPRPPAPQADAPAADDLVRCPRCGTWGIAGKPCETPDCVAARGR